MAATTTSPPAAETLADLLKRLGDIAPRRIRLRPAPGTATEQDVIDLRDRERRCYELVEGVLVEKAMGFEESELAMRLGYFLIGFVRQQKLGIVAGEAGMLRISAGLVRIPDVSFVAWERLPNRQRPKAPIPALAPDLAVEVLSKGNTKREMARKLREYFDAGTRLVWYVEPRSRTVRVFTSPDQATLLGEDQVLDGGAVLPGFALPLRDLFNPD